MINFKLKPYEWQKEMNILFSNSNLEEIIFSRNQEVIFKFISSLDGHLDRSLNCKNVWKIQYEIDSETDFPIFIGDVRIKKLDLKESVEAFEYLNYGFGLPEAKEYHLVCIESGEVSIILLCEEIIENANSK